MVAIYGDSLDSPPSVGHGTGYHRSFEFQVYPIASLSGCRITESRRNKCVGGSGGERTADWYFTHALTVTWPDDMIYNLIGYEEFDYRGMNEWFKLRIGSHDTEELGDVLDVEVDRDSGDTWVYFGKNISGLLYA